MQTADHVLIPLLTGSFALAQVARIEGDRLLLYLTGTQTPRSVTPIPLIDAQIIAALCLDVAMLTTDHWSVIGYEAVPRIAPFYDKPLIFSDPIDPAILEAFANAIHGLCPWDGFPDAALFTNMLRTPSVLPTGARMTADFPKPESP